MRAVEQEFYEAQFAHREQVPVPFLVPALGGVETNNLAYLPRRLALPVGKLPRTSLQVGWDGGTLHYFTMGALCRLFEETGFRVLARTGSGAFARWRNWWPSLLTGDLIVKGIKR